MTIWHFKARSNGFERSTELRLGWEVHGDPITDDFTPEEASAAELWTRWRNQYGGDRLRIYWTVRGDNVAEHIPFDGQGVGGEDFLTFFTWPVDADDQPLRWTDLPVEDKLWNSSRADKGGFIQEHTGWKPSPFQTEMDVELIDRVVSGTL